LSQRAEFDFQTLEFILAKEAQVGRERCCARPWSENSVCKAVVIPGEHGFDFVLLGHQVKSQLHRLSQKAVQSTLLL